MKVAIVHDDLVQWGGAERLLKGLLELFPDAPIYTSVFDRSNGKLYKEFGNRKVVTSFLQNIPGWRYGYKALLPLYPISFEQFNFDKYDLVISQTTRFAKSIITKPTTFHISYCHTPPRFLWHFSKEFHPFLEPFLSNLRIYDRAVSNRVDYFLAGSKNAKKRIKKIYRKNSEVLYPFVDLKKMQKEEIFDGGYFLVVSRLNKYKKVDVVIEACKKLKQPLKIVGTGPEMDKLKSISDENVEFLGELEDDLLIKVMAGCKAVIVAAEEDFGLVSLEAQALGKAVIGFESGGSIETVIDGKTGILFKMQDQDSLIEAISKLDSLKINPDDCRQNARNFSKDNFFRNFKQILADLGRFHS